MSLWRVSGIFIPIRANHTQLESSCSCLSGACPQCLADADLASYLEPLNGIAKDEMCHHGIADEHHAGNNGKMDQIGACGQHDSMCLRHDVLVSSLSHTHPYIFAHPCLPCLPSRLRCKAADKQCSGSKSLGLHKSQS